MTSRERANDDDDDAAFNEGPTDVDTAIDNDIIKKAVCWGLTSALWSGGAVERHIGVLGAAKYVLAAAIDRATLSRDKASAHAELAEFLRSVAVLEPTDRELEFAAQMEVVAQREGLFLDVGESQLAAMMIERAIAALETGDKKAIRAIERMVDQFDAVSPLCGKVRCLEQVILRFVCEDDGFEVASAAVCAEPNVDRTMSICFGCYSSMSAPRDSAVQGLTSYIADVRSDAPRVLAP